MAAKLEKRSNRVDKEGNYTWRWQERIDGKPQKFTVKARNKKEAEQKQAEVMTERARGTYVAPTKTTLAMYLDDWLKRHGRDLAPRTRLNYKDRVRRYVLPKIGKKSLEQLRPAQVQKLYDDLAEQGVSAYQIRYIHAILHKALQDAVYPLQVLRVNPTTGLLLPKLPKPKPNTYGPEELQRLLVAAEKSVMFIAVYLAIYTGMRLGEICALRWSDVNLETGEIQVGYSMTQTPEDGNQFKETKNGEDGSGTLAEANREVLREYRNTQQGPNPEGLVWPNRDGSPRKVNQASRTFRKLVLRAGLPKLRFHDLRHTHATLLLHAKVPMKVVQERLRHKHIMTTMGIYAHTQRGSDAAAAEIMSELVG